MKPIKQIKIKKGMKVSELLDEMKETAFNARKLAEAAEILAEMIKDRQCKIFLGLAGAMVPAGMKRIILSLLDYTDVLVSTGANLTHDLIEALGYKHYKGDERADDLKLHEKGIDRIYDVFMENRVYEGLEKFFNKHWLKFEKCTSIKEFLWKIGEALPANSESILKKCYTKKIPIFCPALSDSGIGLMVWGKKAAGKKIFIDAFEDMSEIISISWKAKKKGVFYIGGGVPKNFIQQSMQFSTPAAYGIQISIDAEEFGGSSGAKLKEGISWGKMHKKGRFVSVICDATIALPLIVSKIV